MFLHFTLSSDVVVVVVVVVVAIFTSVLKILDRPEHLKDSLRNHVGPFCRDQGLLQRHQGLPEGHYRSVGREEP